MQVQISFGVYTVVSNTNWGKHMRFILAAAAIVALSLSSAYAEPAFVSGGPIKPGKMCLVNTDGNSMYGYVTACPKPAAVAMKKKES
jgi:hypothetical protein